MENKEPFGSDPKTLVRRDDPDTSVDAAGSLKNTTALEQRVYEVIRDFGDDGCISDDIVAAIPDLSVVTITPRFAKLIQKGWVIDTGERRKGKSGRSQRVMRAV